MKFFKHFQVIIQFETKYAANGRRMGKGEAVPIERFANSTGSGMHASDAEKRWARCAFPIL